MPITRSNHPSLLWPGVKSIFGLSYAELPAEWSQVFEEDSSDKAYEVLVEATGFGLAPVKSEGASISYDTDGEGYKNTLTHVVYGLGYIVTREEMEDNKYTEVASRRARGLAFAMNTTAEIAHANLFNRAFSTSYPQGESGVALCSASHVTLNGTQSNLLTAADLSESALEDAVKTIRQGKNSRGLNVGMKVKRLIVHTDDEFNATRILKSDLRVSTPNNDINAIKAMGSIPEVVPMTYLTDNDAWFIQSNVPEGLKSMWRRKPGLEKDSDFDTENAKAKSTMRFALGTGDWRCLYGSAGA
jgi:S-adenosylmethionine/arginine decarboxylase-like enzyme